MTPPDKLSHLTEQERRDWELAQKATPGPWTACIGSGYNVCTALRSDDGGDNGTLIADFLPNYSLKEKLAPRDHLPNMKFVEAARTGYPAALEQLSSARGEIAALHRFNAAQCGECGGKGWRIKSTPPHEHANQEQEPCPVCEGLGHVTWQEKAESAESRLRDLLEADVTRARDISRLTIERDQAEQEIDRLNTVERDLREKVREYAWHKATCSADPKTCSCGLAALLEGQHG